MELPKFKYNPNAYKLDLFKEIEGVCSICVQRRNMKLSDPKKIVLSDIYLDASSVENIDCMRISIKYLIKL